MTRALRLLCCFFALGSSACSPQRVCSSYTQPIPPPFANLPGLLGEELTVTMEMQDEGFGTCDTKKQVEVSGVSVEVVGPDGRDVAARSDPVEKGAINGTTTVKTIVRFRGDLLGQYRVVVAFDPVGFIQATTWVVVDRRAPPIDSQLATAFCSSVERTSNGALVCWDRFEKRVRVSRGGVELAQWPATRVRVAENAIWSVASGNIYRHLDLGSGPLELAQTDGLTAQEENGWAADFEHLATWSPERGLRILRAHPDGAFDLVKHVAQSGAGLVAFDLAAQRALISRGNSWTRVSLLAPDASPEIEPWKEAGADRAAPGGFWFQDRFVPADPSLAELTIEPPTGWTVLASALNHPRLLVPQWKDANGPPMALVAERGPDGVQFGLYQAEDGAQIETLTDSALVTRQNDRRTFYPVPTWR